MRIGATITCASAVYFTGVSPDLYAPKYQAKVVDFFDKLLDPKHADMPFMRHYLDDYWDLYWDLHLGVKGDAVPPQVRTLGEAFNTVLAYRNPLQEIVYENYMTVRALRPFLTKWIDEKLNDIENGRIADADKTIAYYWLKNAGDGKHFAKRDVVFECFHNFVALSQWGNSIFGVTDSPERKRRRPIGARRLPKDDERRLRQCERRALHAA